MSTTYNKVTIDDTTLIDLSGDTVSSAADIASGKTGHLNTGATVQGTALTYSSADNGKVVSNGALVAQGSDTVTQNGTVDTTLISSLTVNVSGSSGMNVQAAIGMATKANNAYEATDLAITVAKTGTYTVSWDGCRSSTSGTNGSRIYINNTEQTAYTTFDSTNTRFQHIEMTGVSLTANDVVTLYCRARSASYYMTVSNLVIVQTS